MFGHLLDAWEREDECLVVYFILDSERIKFRVSSQVV